MTDIILNTISSERVSRTATSVEITNGIIVNNIPSDIYGYAKVNWAINYAGLYYGMPHPDNPQARLGRIDAKAITSDCVEMELTYIQNLTEIIVNISTQLYQTETNRAVYRAGAGINPLDGPHSLMKVVYKYPENYQLDEKLRGKVIEKTVTVPKDSHDAIITIQREEDTSYPAVIAQINTFINTLNELGWSFEPMAWAGTYKCIDISADYNNKTGTFIKNYAFARRQVSLPDPENGIYTLRSGWDVDLYYRDHNTGEPPADVVTYTSIDDGVPNPSPGGVRLGVPIYPIANFNDLIMP
jgi:hypothetical protein